MVLWQPSPIKTSLISLRVPILPGSCLYRPSENARARVADLIEQEKTQGLSQDERRELDQYMQLEHVMRLAKAKARQRPSE